MPISIVMPTYNGMKFVKQAVESVLMQHCQDWELVISDDGSQDGTREYLSTVSDPRVQVHFQTENRGIFGNLNFLFSQVHYDLTQILCQDDYFVDAGALDRLLAEWRRLPQEIAFLRCNHLQDARSRLTFYEGHVLPEIVPPEDSDLFFFIFGCIAGNLSNISVRTELIPTAGWFRPDLPYAGDFEFWSRLGAMRPYALRRTSIVHVREHEKAASVTLNRKGEIIPQAREVVERLYTNLVRRGYPPYLLRLMAVIQYTSRQRDRGIKEVLGRKGAGYLRLVAAQLDSARFSFGSGVGWLAYFACLGGRCFGIAVAKRLLNQRRTIGRNVPLRTARCLPGTEIDTNSER